MNSQEHYSIFFLRFIRLFIDALVKVANTIFSTSAYDLSAQEICNPFSESQRFTQPIFSPNRNFNLAVDGPPLRSMNLNTVLSLMMGMNFLVKIKRAEDRNCVKDKILNEKSNHYSRIGQADPYSSAGEW
jgi:hypothetical protein